MSGKLQYEDRVPEILKQYNENLTVKDISKNLQIGEETIKGYLIREGVYKHRNVWGKKEVEILRELYPTGDWDLIESKLPQFSRSCIHAKASRLRLKIGGHFWSQHDKDILKQCYNVIPTEEIQTMLEGTYQIRTIQNQAKKLGLTKSQLWTDDEMKIMKEKYSSLGAMGVMEFLPNKTYPAIIGKARAMGLRCDVFWTEEEKQYLVDNWKNMSDAEIGLELNRTEKGVRDQRYKLGLYYDLGYNGYYTIVNYLRMNITEWKKKSMTSCHYKCALTGRSFDDIHHKYSFNLILRETLDVANIDDKESIDDYTDEELESILCTFHSIQDKYPLGVCLCRDVHKLFHHIYGYGDNTVEQWDQFEQDYKNGLYKTSITD